MRFGINLRGDLAKLDDTALALKYETILSKIEKIIQTLPAHSKHKMAYRIGFGLFIGRGLFHARIFYKIYAAIFRFMAAFGGQTWIEDSELEKYFLDCEMKDTRDEIRRRVRQRQLAVNS